MQLLHLNLPGSSPYTIFSTESPLKHFIWRNGGSGLTFTKLYDRSSFSFDYLDAHFPMGYTNLCIMERVALLHVPTQTWTMFRTVPDPEPISTHTFHIIRSQGMVESYGYTEGKWGQFYSFTAAKKHWENMPQQSVEWLLWAEMLEDIGWH